MNFLDLEETKLPGRCFIILILSTLKLEEPRNLIRENISHIAIINNSDHDQLIEMQSSIKDTIFDLIFQRSNAFKLES